MMHMNVMYLLPFDIRWTSTLGYKYGTVENEKFTPGILNANRATWNNGSEYSYNMYVRSLLSRAVKLGIVNFDLRRFLNFHPKSIAVTLLR